MTVDQVATLRPLAFGIVVVLCTIMIRALALGATVNLVRREQRIGHTGESFGYDLAIVVVAILIAFAAHLIEIAVWAGLFVICGEFTAFGAAFDQDRKSTRLNSSHSQISYA